MRITPRKAADIIGVTVANLATWRFYGKNLFLWKKEANGRTSYDLKEVKEFSVLYAPCVPQRNEALAKRNQEIFSLWKKGKSRKSLAQDFSITVARVGQIIARRGATGSYWDRPEPYGGRKLRARFLKYHKKRKSVCSTQ